MRYIVTLVFSLIASMVWAQDWEDRAVFTSGAGTKTLRVLSSTDAVYLAPILDTFTRAQQDLSLEYFVTGTADIYTIMQRRPKEFDVVISSAMDLQIKLVNDGAALAIRDIDAPEWTHWRQSLFGFTAEPAAIVVNRAAFADLVLPQTRQDLIRTLRTRPDLFAGRVATYDIRSSGLGYLFATQDARTSETFWRLTEVMGALNTQLYCCSGDMISDVASGKMLVAYNVLGSYALAQDALSDRIEVILPNDFATTMIRTVFVNATTEHGELASAFVRYLLESAQLSGLPELTQSTLGKGAQRLVPLEPSLMISLDPIQRRAFTTAWESAIIQ